MTRAGWHPADTPGVIVHGKRDCEPTRDSTIRMSDASEAVTFHGRGVDRG